MPMCLEGPSAGGREQASPLIGIQIQRPLKHRPRRREEEDGSGEIKEEFPARCGPPRGGILADDEPEILERGSQGRLESLHRDIAPIREVTQKQAGVVRPGLHSADDPIHGIEDLEGRRVLARSVLDDREFRKRGCRPAQHEAVELFLPAEVIGDRAGVGPREVADVADRRPAVTMIGKKGRGGLQ